MSDSLRKRIYPKPDIRRAAAIALLGMVVLSVSIAHAQRQYKRVHQNALADVTAGKAAAAEKDLEAFAEKYPKDAETQFMLTIARTGQGKVEAALGSLRQAIELGLPAERFVAGPRNLLEPLAETESLQRIAAEHPVLHHVIGDVTGTSLRVWVRTAKAGPVRVRVTPQGAAAKASEFTAETRADADFTAVVQVDGLQPQSSYDYLVFAGDSDRLAKRGSFHTAPRRGEKSKFRLAFGGGAGYVPENERMWNTILEFDPSLLLLLGDNVYIDRPKSPEMQRYCYYRRQSRPEFQKLVAHTPVYSIWDDHDFGTNDCWGGPAIDEPPWKPEVWQIFRQNWVNPGYGGGAEQPGCWYTFSRGDVDFIMLDGRYYRTNPRAEEPSMLGPVQKKWLKEQLLAARGTFKVLCSPVPWDFRTKGKSLDTWNGFRDEREEIFSFIAENKITGIVLMSADRHRSDAWHIGRPEGYDLYEFNSSRLTNQHVHGTMQAAIFSYNKQQSFGLVTFDTTADDPTVTYEVINIEGEKIHDLTVKLGQLSF